MPPAGPIYASTLHRRDRTWRRRRSPTLRARAIVWSATGVAVAAGLLAHFG